MAGIKIDEVSRRRAAALARRFHKDFVPPLVIARDLPTVAALNSHGGGTVERFKAFPEKAWIWRRTNIDDSSVWVRPRDKAKTRDIFLAFIEELYGEVDYNVPRKYQVDHIHNQANASKDHYIRLEIIPQRINAQHGAGFERRNTHSTIEIAKRGDDEGLMTTIMLLKIAGIAPPRSIDDKVQMSVIRHYFLQQGWPLKEIDQAVATLLTIADWRH